MMKKYLLLINFTCCMMIAAHSQNPLLKQWDFRFGGTNHDALYAFAKTNDGGFLLGGESYSDSSGDKTQNNRDPSLNSADFWIVKIDSLGLKQWDKRFGGTGDDYITSVRQTSDGGYILGGSSESDSSGDKTQNAWGFYDYWIVKTDSSGNKQWDKRFGGISEEELAAVQQTLDGGYILGGYSYSDSSGDKTQHTQGQDDYWMVKTDSLGIKQWDKRFGSSDFDEAYTLQQTADGGYIIGGYSTEGNSGDATQPSFGGWDYWMVKTNSFGVKLWDTRYGGIQDDIMYSLTQTNDHGYILAGCSKSDSSGNKTQHNWDNTLTTLDYWIIKTDSLGTMQWDKNFGGTADDDFIGNVVQTSDKGFLVAGTSYSAISGNKTEDNLGSEQSWIIKTDSSGNFKWDKTIFTTGHDESGFAVQSTDGCYLVANSTNADIGGYKTQLNWDVTNITNDYWVVKFCDSTLTENVNEFKVKGLRFKVYPNPAGELIVISYTLLGNKSSEISIYDCYGRTVLQSEIFNSQSEIILNVSSLSPGIYFIKAGNELRKFVKQ